jgi:Pectate lyase superfamily protein
MFNLRSLVNSVRGLSNSRSPRRSASASQPSALLRGRRDFVSAAIGASSVGLMSRPASAIDPATTLTERIDIRQFGAKGDRLADDIEPIRRAISASEQTDQYPASVFVPAGNFRRSNAVALPNHLCLIGEGVASIFNSQNDDNFDKPILVNQSSAGLIAARIQDLTLYGGSHAIRLDAAQENADLRLHNVTMKLQSVANLEANKLLQTVKISNCVFGSAPWGIRVLGSGTNCFYASGSEWIDHSEGSIFLRGADGVTIIGGRFEGGGRLGKYCIDIEVGSNILFLGCFFENVHEFLARFRGIEGGVVFQSCHFSGTSLSGRTMRAFRWDLGDTLVIFRDCKSLQPMRVGGRIMLEGANSEIIPDDVLIQGNNYTGRLLAQPRMLTPQLPALFIDAVADSGWEVGGQLTLVSEAGQTTEVISFKANAHTPDQNIGASAYSVRLTQTAPMHWALVVGHNNDERHRTKTSFSFAWVCHGTSPPPTIRVPLT